MGAGREQPESPSEKRGDTFCVPRSQRERPAGGVSPLERSSDQVSARAPRRRWAGSRLRGPGARPGGSSVGPGAWGTGRVKQQDTGCRREPSELPPSGLWLGAKRVSCLRPAARGQLRGCWHQPQLCAGSSHPRPQQRTDGRVRLWRGLFSANHAGGRLRNVSVVLRSGFLERSKKSYRKRTVSCGHSPRL